jgi:hypothetical protein
MIIRTILFSLIDLLIRIRPKDGTVVHRLKNVEGTHKWVPAGQSYVPDIHTETWYTFGGKVYRTRIWPAKQTGFVIPWVRSEPEVPWFHEYAGPKRDFHGGPVVVPSKIRRFPYPYIEFTGKGFRFTIGIGYLFQYDPEQKIINLLGLSSLK